MLKLTQGNAKVIPYAHKNTLYQHELVIWRLGFTKLFKIPVDNHWEYLLQSLNILKQAVEKSNNHESFNLIIFVVCILQGLASNVPNSFNCRGLLILRVADGLIDECIWIFVHDVDQHNEGLFDKLVKDTFIIENRLSDKAEEVPHPLTNAILVD